jgi:hypothetical protein
MDVLFIGTMLLHTEDGKKIYIEDSLCVPAMGDLTLGPGRAGGRTCPRDRTRRVLDWSTPTCSSINGRLPILVGSDRLHFREVQYRRTWLAGCSLTTTRASRHTHEALRL